MSLLLLLGGGGAEITGDLSAIEEQDIAAFVGQVESNLEPVVWENIRRYRKKNKKVLGVFFADEEPDKCQMEIEIVSRYKQALFEDELLLMAA